MDSLRKFAFEIASSKSSCSEIASDEDRSAGSLPNEGAEGEPMDLNLELDGSLSWVRYCGEGNRLLQLSAEDDINFTSSPLGIDVCSADPIRTAESSKFVEEYLGAAEATEECKDLFSQIWEADKCYGSRTIGGPHYPFSGSMEWEVVEWLHSLDVPVDRIDRFFELDYVRCHQCMFRSNP